MISAIIQTRMGSTRLPGKVMKIIESDNTILSYVISQLKNCKTLDKIIIATTTLNEDDVIFDYAKKEGIDCFRGSSDDVLDRHYQCAKKFSCTDIVRIPSDKPLIDPTIVDKIVTEYKKESYDYVSNFLNETFPNGTEVEIFSFETLEKTWRDAKKPSEREHVVPYIMNNPKIFQLHNYSNSEDFSKLRYVVDRKEDLELVKEIVSRIDHRPILMDDIIKIYKNEPAVFEINRYVDRHEGELRSAKDDEKFVGKN